MANILIDKFFYCKKKIWKCKFAPMKIAPKQCKLALSTTNLIPGKQKISVHRDVDIRLLRSHEPVKVLKRHFPSQTHCPQRQAIGEPSVPTRLEQSLGKVPVHSVLHPLHCLLNAWRLQDPHEVRLLRGTRELAPELGEVVEAAGTRSEHRSGVGNAFRHSLQLQTGAAYCSLVVFLNQMATVLLEELEFRWVGWTAECQGQGSWNQV